ncbi:MAG: ABC transporter ATP-binding protein [Candidatus Pedobacter colombiensis]|uniref:ABC transporter ATP-binding protein n=1 Tax=Candidatus Pedobacter colombiensis TaxID=3121371 RepID=A0AAJ5WBY9_9SPHI|nr:ABC transporter ATP-binding protein [Pedobacter sp.]WEK21223.1 MAG: ABC transporter ATP-binding protein [Pedobacter sp.]
MNQSISDKIKKLKTNLNIKRTLQLVWSIARGWTLVVVIMIFLETIFMLGSLYSLKLLVDIVSKSDLNNLANGGIVLKYVLFAGVIGILYNVIRALSAYTGEIQAARVSENIDDKIHDIAANLELSFYESPEYFDVLKRAKDAGSYRPNQVILSLLDIAKNLLNLFGVALILISINWLLLPMLVLFVLPTLLVRIYFSDKQNVLRIRHTPTERKTSYLSTLITSDTTAKEVRSYNLGSYFKAQYFQIRMSLLEERLKISFNRTLGEVATSVLSTVGFFVCIGYIMLRTAKGYSTLGDATLFLVIFPQTFNVLQNIASGISTVYQNNIFVSSIFELFDLKENVVIEDDTRPIPNNEMLDLELRNVDFAYPGTNKLTLRGINMKIPSGKIIAVVGLNGAGKTTLIKLLCRLYEPISGVITLGGQNIRDFSKVDYSKQISVVFQDFCKYNFSAADNIKFGDIKRLVHQMEDIINVAKHSGAHNYIKDFEHKYDTMMGKVFDDGREISIGQWQKLATARALYSSSRFLILDEATSALDAVAEKELFDSFRQHIGNRAALVISHRHSAVKHADYIYVLSGTQILQEGTDKELLEMEGDYARLFKNKSEQKVN